jgi:hypothetical protein
MLDLYEKVEGERWRKVTHNVPEKLRCGKDHFVGFPDRGVEEIMSPKNGKMCVRMSFPAVTLIVPRYI